VLRDVPGIGDAPAPRTDDPFELRRQAIDGLRELLHRTSIATPLVLVIDDLQWCDDDTADMLLELLGDGRPGALFIAGVRTDETAIEPDAPMARLAAGLDTLASEIAIERMSLGPIGGADAVAIATAVLGDRPDRDRLAAAIAAECEGSPLFAAELARHVADAHAPRTATERPRLEDVLEARMQRLPSEAVAVLEMIAVAARPIAQHIAIEAADARARGLEAIAMLRSQAMAHRSRRTTIAWRPTCARGCPRAASSPVTSRSRTRSSDKWRIPRRSRSTSRRPASRSARSPMSRKRPISPRRRSRCTARPGCIASRFRCSPRATRGVTPCRSRS
jgi:hypothetical protein